jgi:hypothetical protein
MGFLVREKGDCRCHAHVPSSVASIHVDRRGAETTLVDVVDGNVLRMLRVDGAHARRKQQAQNSRSHSQGYERDTTGVPVLPPKHTHPSCDGT